MRRGVASQLPASHSFLGLSSTNTHLSTAVPPEYNLEYDDVGEDGHSTDRPLPFSASFSWHT